MQYLNFFPKLEFPHSIAKMHLVLTITPGNFLMIKIQGVFRQTNVALTRWVKKGSTFILIWVARTLAK